MPEPMRPQHPGRRRRAPNGTQRYLQITVLLPPDLIAAMDQQGDTEQISRSMLIRKATLEYLRRAAKRAAREE